MDLGVGGKIWFQEFPDHIDQVTVTFQLKRDFLSHGFEHLAWCGPSIPYQVQLEAQMVKLLGDFVNDDVATPNTDYLNRGAGNNVLLGGTDDDHLWDDRTLRIATKLIAKKPIKTWANGRLDCKFPQKYRKNGLAGHQANKGELHA